APIFRQPIIVPRLSQTLALSRFGRERACARENAERDQRRDRRLPMSGRGETEGAGPRDRGERLREGRDPRRGLAAAEVLASRLGAEPKLDQRRRGGRNGNAASRNQRIVRRGKRHGGDEGRE